jgi:hypothetical protein
VLNVNTTVSEKSWYASATSSLFKPTSDSGYTS